MESGKLGLSFTDDINCLTQSYTDIRRLAAENAARRLQTLMAKHCPQEVSKGRPSKLDENCVKRVTLIWNYVVKYQDVLAAKISTRLKCENPKRHNEVINAVRLNKSQTDSMKRIYKSQEGAQNGRCLIGHISDILSNLRNAKGLKKSLKSKICMLVEAGYSKDNVMRKSHSLTYFLAEHLPSHWSAQIEQAWTTMLTYILQLGSKLWDKIDKDSSGKKTKNSLPLADIKTGLGRKKLPFR
ncbi:hypothetical protein Bpfe_020752 [Biomphalaria pfeifferi]|uniref:Uncharacterized protein n=1 Tax=Biomphalaria pfeifferi TaxID=112525 RepID=A0AAD8BAN2_BIOPF|nr:hypothetical protein Bpfe_020752 [Biomphalaria pfeifferi]